MHKKEKWGEKKQMELISKHLHTITTLTNTLKQAHKSMVRTNSNVLHIETNRAFIFSPC